METDSVFERIRMIMNSGTIFGYFLQVVPITLVVALVYFIIRYFLIKRNRKVFSWKMEITRLVFVCYVTGLFNLVLMPANFWLAVMDRIAYGWWNEIPFVFSTGTLDFNLVPTVVKWLKRELEIGNWVKHMLVYNIVMFIPLGFLIPLVSKKANKKNSLIAAVTVPLLIELLQLISGRSLDIDDIICNFIGIIIGYVLSDYIKQKNEQLYISQQE